MGYVLPPSRVDKNRSPFQRPAPHLGDQAGRGAPTPKTRQGNPWGLWSGIYRDRTGSEAQTRAGVACRAATAVQDAYELGEYPIGARQQCRKPPAAWKNRHDLLGKAPVLGPGRFAEPENQARLTRKTPILPQTDWRGWGPRAAWGRETTSAPQRRINRKVTHREPRPRPTGDVRKDRQGYTVHRSLVHLPSQRTTQGTCR